MCESAIALSALSFSSGTVELGFHSSTNQPQTHKRERTGAENRNEKRNAKEPDSVRAAAKLFARRSETTHNREQHKTHERVRNNTHKQVRNNTHKQVQNKAHEQVRNKAHKQAQQQPTQDTKRHKTQKLVQTVKFVIVVWLSSFGCLSVFVFKLNLFVSVSLPVCCTVARAISCSLPRSNHPAVREMQVRLHTQSLGLVFLVLRVSLPFSLSALPALLFVSQFHLQQSHH